MYKAVITLLLAGSMVFAGCTGSPGGNPANDEVDHEVKVVNAENASHTVSVTIRRGGETVLDEERDIGEGAEWDVTTQSDPGSYTVVVTTESGDTVNESYTLPLAQGDRRSFTVVRVNESGGLEARTYWQD